MILAADPCLRRVAAEQDRMPELDPRARSLGAQRRTRAEMDPGREVLDLALAIDRGVRDDGDRLVQVVGEVRPPLGEGRERPVVPQRTDRLVRRLGHRLRHADVVGLPPQGGEELLAPLRDVLELVRRRADLPAWT